MAGKEEERIAEVFDLFQTDHTAELAFAFAAATHVETQRNVAEFVQDARRLQHARRVAVSSKAVQNQECRTASPRLDFGRDADNAIECNPADGMLTTSSMATSLTRIGGDENQRDETAKAGDRCSGAAMRFLAGLLRPLRDWANAHG